MSDFISRKIICGDIFFESKEGKGAKFTVRLPVAVKIPIIVSQETRT
ncbi:MAG: hypothetical protein ABH836_02530 [Candidatus Omnitrophota bacterium]